MGLFGGIALGLGSIASTVLANNSAKHEAERNRDWQEDMSNTSVQRRVADLKAAGLNPLLAVSSASSGASTPTGGQANLKHFDPATITTMMNGLASAKLTQAQAKAQEQENSIFETKARILKAQAYMEEKKLITEEINQQIMKTNNVHEIYKILKTQADIHHVNISADELMEKAKLLRFRNEIYENGFNEEMYNKYPGLLPSMISENTNGMSSIGFSSAVLLGKTIADYKKWKEEYQKGFKPRGYNEKYISR